MTSATLWILEGGLRPGGPIPTIKVGARGMSSVRYRTRLGDLKNKQSTESLMYAVRVGIRFLDSIFPRNLTSDVQHDPGAAGSE